MAAEMPADQLNDNNNNNNNNNNNSNNNHKKDDEPPKLLVPSHLPPILESSKDPRNKEKEGDPRELIFSGNPPSPFVKWQFKFSGNYSKLTVDATRRMLIYLQRVSTKLLDENSQNPFWVDIDYAYIDSARLTMRGANNKMRTIEYKRTNIGDDVAKNEKIGAHVLEFFAQYENKNDQFPDTMARIVLEALKYVKAQATTVTLVKGEECCSRKKGNEACQSCPSVPDL